MPLQSSIPIFCFQKHFGIFHQKQMEVNTICVQLQLREYDHICEERRQRRERRAWGGVPSLLDLASDVVIDAVMTGFRTSSECSRPEEHFPTPIEQHGVFTNLKNSNRKTEKLKLQN